MKKILACVISIIAVAVLITGCEQVHTHEFGEWNEVRAASCIEDGKRVRLCECGEAEEEIISATGHVEEVIAEKTASCTKSGLTEGKKCSVCGVITVKQEAVEALGHEEKTLDAVAPTCDADGLTEGVECSRCGKILVAQDSVSAFGHSYVYYVDENGEDYMLCTRDDCEATVENAAGLYDADNKLIASWDELTDKYGLNVECNYSDGDFEKKKTHLTYILNNYDELKNARTLIIDKGVESIGARAFQSCATLENIKLPDEINRLGLYAFSHCESLKKIIIPDGIKEICYNDFQYCTSLEYVYIPASVEYIEPQMYSFIGCCSIKSFEVAEDSKYYSSIDGSLYSKNGDCLVKYATGREDPEFYLPESVKEIYCGAFSYSLNLKSIYLHNGITTVYGNAFSNAPSIEDVYFNGTEQEWEALNIHGANYPNDVVFHYDGIERFMTFRFAGDFGSSGNTGIIHFKIQNEKVYIMNHVYGEWVLYTEISKVDDLNIEYTEYVYEHPEMKDKDKALEILKNIQALGDWYVLKGENAEGTTETRIVCYLDGVIYCLYVREINADTNTATVPRITSANISLED